MQEPEQYSSVFLLYKIITIHADTETIGWYKSRCIAYGVGVIPGISSTKHMQKNPILF